MTNFIRRASAVAVASAAVVGGLLLGASPASAATVTVGNVTYEAKVVKLTNDARVKNGCAAMRTEAKLTTAARAHSADMIAQNYFSHTGKNGSTFVTRTKAAGYLTAIGENIAWGYRTPEAVVDAWLKSPGHRANILNCKAKAVGVGVATKADGTPYWTQIFGSV